MHSPVCHSGCSLGAGLAAVCTGGARHSCVQRKHDGNGCGCVSLLITTPTCMRRSRARSSPARGPAMEALSIAASGCSQASALGSGSVSACRTRPASASAKRPQVASAAPTAPPPALHQQRACGLFSTHTQAGAPAHAVAEPLLPLPPKPAVLLPQLLLLLPAESAERPRSRHASAAACCSAPCAARHTAI